MIAYIRNVCQTTEWRLFLTVWLVYLFHLAPLTGANENRYLDLVISMVDEGRFEIDTYHYNTIDKSYRQGHYYAGAAPGPAFLAIPAYVLFKAAGPLLPASLFSQYDKVSYIRGYLGGAEAPDAFVESYPFGRFLLLHLWITALTCSLLSAAMAALVYRIARQWDLDRLSSLTVALTCAFGTTAFYYSTRLYPHISGTFFAFLGFALLAQRRMTDRAVTPTVVFGAGICIGAALLTDYALLPTAGCVGIYLLATIRDRRLVYGILGGLIPMGLLLAYHAVCFGSPFKTAYGFPNGPVDDGTHRFYEENFHGFSLPPLNQIWGLSFSLFRGLFWYVPVALLAVYALIHALLKGAYRRAEWLLVAGVIVTQFLFNAMMHPNYWIGGWDFGPRFLTPMMPFLVLPLALLLRSGRLPRSVIFGMIAVSVLINWIGVQYGPSHALFGVVSMFFLSGPSTPLYIFLEQYIRTYTTWAVSVSPVGGFLILSLLLWFIWRSHDVAVKEA